MPEFDCFGFRAHSVFLLYFQNISHPFAQNSSASLTHHTHHHHYHPDQEYASAQQLYSNNCNGDFMSSPQLLVSAHSCETTTLLHDRDVNGGTGGVLYNHQLRYNESYVLNGSSCSNHLNSSLSASQSSLPPPPTPSDLDDMMMMMNGDSPQRHLHNASNHYDSAENIYNTATAAAATNHNSHLYHDPRQTHDRMMVTRGVQLNGDNNKEGCVDVQDGELETVSMLRLSVVVIHG